MNKLNDNLVDVRMAYRLIYEYQQSLLGTIKNIEQRLLKNADKIRINPRYSFNPPNKSEHSSSESLGRPAWDWLNLYCVEFRYELEKNYYFSILHLADSGWYDSENDEPDYLKTNTFAPVENSNTYLFFLSGKQKDVDKNAEYISEAGNLFKKEKSTVIFKNRSSRIKRFFMSDFSTVEEIDKSIQDYKKFVHNDAEFASLLK